MFYVYCTFINIIYPVKDNLKKKIVKCTILSVVLYGAETWTMTQADKERLEAFEMWIWRRMLKISWVDKVSNAATESTRKQEHLTQCTTSSIQMDWTHPETWFTFKWYKGRMKGKVIRGRKWLQMLSDVISKSYEELKREVEDRSWWKKGRHKPAIQGRKPKKER